MAFAVETFNDVNPFGGFVLRPGMFRGILTCAVITGVGIVASSWMMATVATTQTMVMSLSTSTRILPELSVALVNPQERMFRAASAPSRALPVAAQTSPSGSSATTAPSTPEKIATTMALASTGPAVLTAEAFADRFGPASANVPAALFRRARLPIPASLTAAMPLEHPHGVAQVQPAASPVTNTASIAPSLPPAVSDQNSPAVAATSTEQPSEIVTAYAAPATTENTPATIASTPVVMPLEHPHSVVIAKADPPAAETVAAAEPARPVPVPIPAPSAPEIADAMVRSSTDETDTDGSAPLSETALTDVPLPMARPQGLAERAPPPPVERLEKPPGRLLAYARPSARDEDEDPAPVRPAFMPRPRSGTAVYDIQAHTVYLPSGERLEAHSGLSYMHDNPRYVSARNRGPTPPHTYDLTLRESLFHGVQAIRLNPIGGEGNVFGRTGLLAHTYMLGARGDSNGCVSFKDYRRFLAAYKRGEINRLVVVASMSSSPFRMASN